MPSLKTYRRPANRATGRPEVTAAATSIDLSTVKDAKYFDAVSRASRSTGYEPWKWYKKLGVVHYSVARSARVAGYADWYVERRNDDGVWERVETGQWADFCNGIYSPFDGQRGLTQRFFTQQKVPADSYLIRVRDDDGDPDGYHYLSANEIDASSTENFAGARPKGEIRWVTLPASRGTLGLDDDRLIREVKPEDVLGRVWSPSYEYVELPDSPLMALRTECDALHKLTGTILAKLKSRFALAGLFYIPSEIGEAKVAGQPGVTTTTDVLEYLSRAFTSNIENWETAEAVTSILLRGPGAASEQLNHITFDRTIDKTDIELRTELIERILFGMDVQQSAVTGGEEVSHWGSWNASDEERRIAVAPDLEIKAWAETRLILHATMLKADMDPAEILRHRIWFDLDRASVRTNAQEDRRQAHDRLVANAKALADSTGLEPDERLDPNSDEYVRMVGLKTQNARLMLWGTEAYDKIPWDEIEPVKPPGPAESRPGDKQKTGPGVGDPGSPNGAKRSTPKRATPA